MIDIHSHIIFDIDDGARSIETSVELCRQAVDNGFDGVTATPHFTNYRKIDDFLLERDSKLDLIRERLEEEGIDITLYAGAELYLSRGIFSAGDLDFLTINNSRYMLCEFPLGPFDVAEGFDEIYELISRGYTPILAHPERYSEVRRDAKIITRLLSMGVLFQVNADSLAGNLDPRAQKIAVDMVKNGTASFIASDAHDAHYRNMKFRKKFSTVPTVISQKDLINCLQKNPEAVINDECVL